MGSGHIAKYRINLDLLRHSYLWVGEWVGSGQMTNFIKLELINIIQICLKKFQIAKINLDLIEIIQLWTFWTFLDIFLNHLSPLWGYFFRSEV